MLSCKSFAALISWFRQQFGIFLKYFFLTNAQVQNWSNLNLLSIVLSSFFSFFFAPKWSVTYGVKSKGTLSGDKGQGRSKAHINPRQYPQQQQSPLKWHGIGHLASEVSDVPFEEKGKIDFYTFLVQRHEDQPMFCQLSWKLLSPPSV